MTAETDQMSTESVAERIFESTTLESAIFWRKVLRERFVGVVGPSALDPAQFDEKPAALFVLEVALAHLYTRLADDERVRWLPEQRRWLITNRWQKR